MGHIQNYAFFMTTQHEKKEYAIWAELVVRQFPIAPRHGFVITPAPNHSYGTVGAHFPGALQWRSATLRLKAACLLSAHDRSNFLPDLAPACSWA